MFETINNTSQFSASFLNMFECIQNIFCFSIKINFKFGFTICQVWNQAHMKGALGTWLLKYDIHNWSLQLFSPVYSSAIQNHLLGGSLPNISFSND